MAKMNNLKRKRLLDHARGWYVLIDISDLYKYFKFLVTNWFLFWFFDDPLCNGILLLLYSLPFFHLSLSHVDQIANLLDTCPIITFLKSLWVAVRLEVTVKLSLPH